MSTPGDDQGMTVRHIAAIGAALGLTLGGCSSQEESMHDRIRDGLPDESIIATAMDDQPTKTDEVTLPQLPAWQLTRVRATGERPLTAVVASPRDGDPRTVVLSGHPDRWEQIIEDGTVETADDAADVARAWYDATRRTNELWYQVDSVDDIDWQPAIDAAEVDRLKQKHRSTISAPTTGSDGDGWTVTLWAVQQRDLVRHEVRVGADASVHAEQEVAEKGMPVSESV